MNGLQLPSWIIPLAGLGAAIWAIAMWWMVASLPVGEASEADHDLVLARAEIDALEVTVDELSQQIAVLHQERGDLAQRLERLETVPSTVVTPMAEPSTALAGLPPAEDMPTGGEQSEEAATDDTTSEESNEEEVAAPATPTEPTEQEIVDSSVPSAVQYFTDGQDRYNCRDFDSWEEAQAAYEANLPGDPNNIDIDRNGIACEALR